MAEKKPPEQEIQLTPSFEPAVITADFKAIRANVEKMIEPYQGMTPEIVAGMDLGEVKTCCADLRRISNELNDGCKAIKKAYNKPLDDFEAKIKEIDALIKAPLEILDKTAKLADKAAREARRAHLEEAYMDFAPAIAELVPFDRILDPRWTNKTFGEKKAEDAMAEKVAGIAAEYQSFERIKEELHFPDEAEAEFWRTLSLAKALNYDAQRFDENQRIQAMRAERDAYRTAQLPPDEPDEAPCAPPIHAEQDPPIVLTNADFEPVSVWMVAVEMTEAQKLLLTDYLRGVGIHGSVCRTAFATCKEAIECARRAANA